MVQRVHSRDAARTRIKSMTRQRKSWYRGLIVAQTHVTIGIAERGTKGKTSPLRGEGVSNRDRRRTRTAAVHELATSLLSQHLGRHGSVC